jgi:hypothetical protein
MAALAIRKRLAESSRAFITSFPFLAMQALKRITPAAKLD